MELKLVEQLYLRVFNCRFPLTLGQALKELCCPGVMDLSQSTILLDLESHAHIVCPLVVADLLAADDVEEVQNTERYQEVKRYDDYIVGVETDRLSEVIAMCIQVKQGIGAV